VNSFDRIRGVRGPGLVQFMVFTPLP
jgi:hypothetical protein